AHGLHKKTGRRRGQSEDRRGGREGGLQPAPPLCGGGLQGAPASAISSAARNAAEAARTRIKASSNCSAVTGRPAAAIASTSARTLASLPARSSILTATTPPTASALAATSRISAARLRCLSGTSGRKADSAASSICNCSIRLNIRFAPSAATHERFKLAHRALGGGDGFAQTVGGDGERGRGAFEGRAIGAG